jgi:hypothetical protein
MNQAIYKIYSKYPEPIHSLFLALRDVILATDDQNNESISHSAPFFRLKNKTVCYLWVHKSTNKPYIGFPEGFRMPEHSSLSFHNRKRIKSLWINPLEDIPVKLIQRFVAESVDLLMNS